MNFSCSALLYMKIRVSFNYFVHNCKFKDNIWAVDLAEWNHCLLKVMVLNICYVF